MTERNLRMRCQMYYQITNYNSFIFHSVKKFTDSPQHIQSFYTFFFLFLLFSLCYQFESLVIIFSTFFSTLLFSSSFLLLFRLLFLYFVYEWILFLFFCRFLFAVCTHKLTFKIFKNIKIEIA